MKKIVKGEIFYFTDAPSLGKNPQDFSVYLPKGAICIEDGLILEVGQSDELERKHPDTRVIDYGENLIMPGFIDTHIHYPQTEMIGSYGKQLIDWLQNYTFPVESQFADAEYATRIAKIFIKELFRYGTTTCMCYASVHPQSAQAIFKVASQFNMRIIAGKVLMDCNCPECLMDGKDYKKQTQKLIDRWHNKGRASYAVTPRFALTCSAEQLKVSGELLRENPSVYFQTHISENKLEIKTALELFPECEDYLEIYEKHGLLTSRSVFAHGIHLSDSEMCRIAKAGASIAHSPTSNVYLGSGLFDMGKANKMGVQTTIATDVGAGTSFSLLRTMNEAYKIQQLNGYPMNAYESFYKSTLGAAKALHLEDKIGSFGKGKEADFIVLSYKKPYLQKLRTDYLQRESKWDVEKMLFGLQMMGDDRNILATYIMGERIEIVDEDKLR